MSRIASYLAALVLAAILVQPASAQASPSGGIGLSIEEFETIHGPGEPGQSLMIFTLDDGIVVNTGIADGFVDYIEIDLTGTADGGLRQDDADALAESFLPTDIERNEHYTGAGGPKQIAVRPDVIIWESDWLDDNVFHNREHIVGIFHYERADIDGQLADIATSIFLIVED